MKKIIGITYLIAFIPLGYAFEFKSDSGAKLPLEIQADNGISCNQTTNVCEASGNVVIAQGATVLKADNVTVHLKRIDDNHQNLNKIEPKGNVSIHSTIDKKSLTADHGFYDIEQGVMEFFGTPVHIKLDTGWIEANHIYYHEKTNLVTAEGNAKALKDGSIITAPTLKAVLKRENNQKLAIQKVQADGTGASKPGLTKNRIKVLLNKPMA